MTIDHVNPEAPWPELERLARETEAKGFTLAPRLAVYPEFQSERWHDASVMPHVLHAADARGLARDDRWAAGEQVAIPFTPRDALPIDTAEELGEPEIERLFAARGEELHRVFAAADALRREVNGDTVTYVVTRNVNYTNVCYFRCGFCAFSKGRLAANLRGKPYLVPLDEIVRRGREAWDRGAVELCLQGGIHPGFTGDTYLDICRALKAELPDLHIHAFSALEVWQGAATLGLPLEAYLGALRDAGLSSLPGTAAEILDDEVRRVICPDKVTTAQWLRVHDVAHRVGLRSTTTIMFGHVEQPRSWARHLVELREQQRSSGGFTEFVPLPFVHMEAPIYLRGQARPGPTFREAHAHARRRAPGVAPADHEHPGVLGQARGRGCAGRAAGRRERPRRDADERVDLACGRRRPRPGVPAGGDGGRDSRDRPDAAPADDALRRAARRAGRHVVRRAAARRSRSTRRRTRRG